MMLAADTIKAMCEGMRRVKRIPECEWLAPVIERLERLKPGERIIIERIDPWRTEE